MHALKLKQAAWMGLFLLLLCGSAVLAANEDSSFDNLDIVDPGLVGKVGIERVGSEVGENKLLSVFAGLKNKTGHQLNLQVQTIYKDTFGNALNSGSWIAFNLKPHEEREYHSASISVQATDFLVRVRRAPTAATTTP